MQKKLHILFLFFALSCGIAQAQSKEAARYEIDVKRVNLDFNDREALLRSREFIRLDSTYYVGYLYEGVFLYERAADYAGYRNCIAPLKKGLRLLEKDFSAKLSAQYSSRAEYEPLRMVQNDYQLMTYDLIDSYSNLNYPDSVMLVLDHYKKQNLQRDMMGANNYMAWTIHRNRFFTKDKYDFLENSIKANDEKALNLLHASVAQVDKNAAKNQPVFGELNVYGDKLSAYHYLAMIHEYEHNMDSAYYYFEKMSMYSIFPLNNFAIFLYVNGNFSEADSYFRASRMNEIGDKRLRECEYYYVTLQVMKGDPVDGIKHINDVIRDCGNTPGWGWYNIAMARGFLYNGQIDKAEYHLNKARNFKELHIGTTWGQSHYNSAIQFLETQISQDKMTALQFENRLYWLSPSALAKMAKYKSEQLANQFVLINEIAANPEREDVFFRIFASENTITFDEIYNTLSNGFANKYFAKLYEKFITTDKRVSIQKYFKLFLANIYRSLGKDTKALKLLGEVNNEFIDEEYEQLFLARVYELYAHIGLTDKERARYLIKFYETYPQLVPYSKLRMPFRLDVHSDETNKTEDEVLSKLQNYNIRIVKNSEIDVPKVRISFTNDGKTDVIEFEVKISSGRDIVPPTKIAYNNVDDVTKRLAYGIFNIINPVLPVDAVSPAKKLGN